MSLNENDLLHKLFLGDNTAWDEIACEYYDRTLNFLVRQYRNLSFAEIEDVVADWFAETLFKVDEERNRADAEGKANDLSPAKIAEIKLEYCAKRFGFNFANPFEAWLRFVLKNKVIDYYRQKSRRGETNIEEENPGDNWRGAGEVEFSLSIKEFRKIIRKALGEREFLYFQIWENYGWKPGGKVVREIFKARLGQDLSESSISIIRHRFIRISYLTFIRIEYDARTLIETFRRFIGADENEETFFDDMMQIIWDVFCEDAEAREQSVERISPMLWKHRETLVQRKSIQNKILVEAFRFFRGKSPRKFCEIIELYAANPFGGKVKNLFFEDEGNSENE